MVAAQSALNLLDRLGTTIIKVAQPGPKQLLWLGLGFLVLFLVVNSVSVFRPFRGFVDWLQNLLGWPMIVLGVICLGLSLLGPSCARSPTDRVSWIPNAATPRLHDARPSSLFRPSCNQRNT